MIPIAELQDRLRRFAKRREAEGNYTDAVLCAEAAERLAGARVKMPSGELCRYIEQCREISNGGEYPWWSRLAEILSALAEPAGEAEPVACVACEDSPKGENNPCAVCGKAATPPDASAIREALEAIRALSGLDGELCKASATIMSRMADIHQTADAALAGAKP